MIPPREKEDIEGIANDEGSHQGEKDVESAVELESLGLEDELGLDKDDLALIFALGLC